MSGNKKILIYFKKIGPYHWARLLALSRHAELYIFTSAPSSDDNNDDEIAYPVLDSSGQLKTFYLSNPGHFKSAAHWEKLDHLSPDFALLGAWSDPIALELLRWCRKKRLSALVMSDTTLPDKWRLPLLEKAKGALIRSYSGALVAGTCQESYIRGLGYPGPIEKGYSAVDNDLFRLGAAKARQSLAGIRRELGLPEYYFAVPARLVHEKAIHTAIEALGLADKNGMDGRWCLAIAGKGPLRKKLEDLAAKLGLKNRVSFMGSVNYDNMPAFYALAAATVLPSKSEPWGLVVNESMASGTPVVVSSICGSVKDLVRHGENGFVFEHGDVSALAAHMLALSENAALGQGMGQAGQQTISDWGLDRFVRATLTLAESIDGREVPKLGLWGNFFLWNLARI